MKLSELLGKPVDVTVTLRGKTTKFAPITLAARNAITQAFPPVRVPMRAHPNYGSADRTAPMIPDPGDSGYQRDCEIREANVSAAELAASIDLEVGGRAFSALSPSEYSKWFVDAAAEILASLTEAEVVVTMRKARTALVAAIDQQEVQKN